MTFVHIKLLIEAMATGQVADVLIRSDQSASTVEQSLRELNGITFSGDLDIETDEQVCYRLTIWKGSIVESE